MNLTDIHRTIRGFITGAGRVDDERGRVALLWVAVIRLFDRLATRSMSLHRSAILPVARVEPAFAPSSCHMIPPPSESAIVPTVTGEIVTVRVWIPTNREIHVGGAHQTTHPTAVEFCRSHCTNARRKPEEQVPQLI